MLCSQTQRAPLLAGSWVGERSPRIPNPPDTLLPLGSHPGDPSQDEKWAGAQAHEGKWKAVREPKVQQNGTWKQPPGKVPSVIISPPPLSPT